MEAQKFGITEYSRFSVVLLNFSVLDVEYFRDNASLSAEKEFFFLSPF